MDETPVKPAENPRRGNPNAADAALKHSYHRIAPALERGLDIIPPESPLHPVIAARRAQIHADAGGIDNLSQTRLDLIEQYLATLVLISSVDAYLVRLEHPRTSQAGRQMAALGIVDRREHKLRPIVTERNRLIETALKLAAAIGLDKQAAPIPSLQEYLAAKARESSTTTNDGHGRTSSQKQTSKDGEHAFTENHDHI